MRCPEYHDYKELTIERIQPTKKGNYRIDYKCNCGERFSITHRKGILKHSLIIESLRKNKSNEK